MKVKHFLNALEHTRVHQAIKAAEEGYVVAPRIAFDWKNGFDKLKKGTNTERYLLPHGKPAVAGDVIRQPELGKTLRAIAKDGRDAFYKGPVAEDMVETLRGIGGLHTLDDFAGHSTDTAPAYRGFDIFALSSDTEQMPLSVLEAMAARLPVAATDVGDVRGMLAEANGRFVVPRDDAALAEALSGLLRDPARRRAIGADNRAKAERDYDQATMFAAWAALSPVSS